MGRGLRTVSPAHHACGRHARARVAYHHGGRCHQRESMAYEPRKFDEDARRRFLAFYEQHGRFYQAAQAAGVCGSTVNRALKEDPAFAERFEESKGIFRDSVEQEVHRRAIEGYDEYVTTGKGLVLDPTDPDGKRPLMQRRFSDRLLELHTKRHIKEYRDKQDAPVTNVTNVLLVPGAQTVDQWQATQLALQQARPPGLQAPGAVIDQPKDPAAK